MSKVITVNDLIEILQKVENKDKVIEVIADTFIGSANACEVKEYDDCVFIG